MDHLDRCTLETITEGRWQPMTKKRDYILPVLSGELGRWKTHQYMQAAVWANT